MGRKLLPGGEQLQRPRFGPAGTFKTLGVKARLHLLEAINLFLPLSQVSQSNAVIVTEDDHFDLRSPQDNGVPAYNLLNKPI